MASSFLNQAGLPRGLRNNNPGNIKVGDDWKGEIGNDGIFVQFSNVAWGIRAMATIVSRDISVKGLNTIRKYINVYAPSFENGVSSTDSYVNAVSRSTGIGPDQVLSLNTNTLHKLLRAQIDFEVGGNYGSLVSDADIDEGIAMMNSDLLALFKQATDSPGNIVKTLIGIALIVYAVKLAFSQK